MGSIGYSAMPEKLALWTVKEAYFSDLVDTLLPVCTDGCRIRIRRSIQTPFTGDYVNLYKCDGIVESLNSAVCLG